MYSTQATKFPKLSIEKCWELGSEVSLIILHLSEFLWAFQKPLGTVHCVEQLHVLSFTDIETVRCDLLSRPTIRTMFPDLELSEISSRLQSVI